MIDLKVADHEPAAMQEQHHRPASARFLRIVKPQRDIACRTRAGQVADDGQLARLGLRQRTKRAHLLSPGHRADILHPAAAHLFQHGEEGAGIVAHEMFGVGHRSIPSGYRYHR